MPPVSISPAAALEQPTLNSLRYGQVVTATAPATTGTKKKRAGGGGARERWEQKRPHEEEIMSSVQRDDGSGSKSVIKLLV